MEIGAAPAGVHRDAIDAAGVGVVAIVAELVEDIEGDEQESAEADGEAKKVDAGEEFASRQVPPGGEEVVV